MSYTLQVCTAWLNTFIPFQCTKTHFPSDVVSEAKTSLSDDISQHAMRASSSQDYFLTNMDVKNKKGLKWNFRNTKHSNTSRTGPNFYIMYTIIQTSGAKAILFNSRVLLHHFRGRKLIAEVTCWVLVTPPITSGKVWDKSQSLPLQGITWYGWASEQKIWVNVDSRNRRSLLAEIMRHKWMWRSLTWNRLRLANECDGWGGALLQNPIQTTLPPLFFCVLYEH